MKEPKESTLFQFREFSHALGCCRGFGLGCGPGELAFVVGTGGAGKTELSKLVGREAFGDRSTWKRGTVPFLRAEADNPDRAYFSSKALTSGLLRQLRDPFRSHVTDVAAWDVDDQIKMKLIDALKDAKPIGSSEPNMREVFISLARMLELKLLLIDEANLLVLVQSGRIPTDFLESVRRLGDQIGCGIMAFGTFDLLELMDYSAPVNRREFRIHLDRMRCEDAHGMEEFRDFLYSVEQSWGLADGLLTSKAGEMYEWTYGIPGEVNGILKRANYEALGLNLDSVGWDLISRYRHHPRMLEQMRLEADVIHSVMTGADLTVKQKATIEKRKKVRLKARRLRAGSNQ